MPTSLARLSSRTRLFYLSIAILVATTSFGYQMFFSRRVSAAGFAAGNLVVYRVGDGAAGLGSTATVVFLDEYTPSGTLVQSIQLPTAVNGLHRRLTASGTATSEGFLTRSADGNYVVLTGYDAALGTASVAGTASATVNRVVGRVDSLGTVDTTTAISDSFSAGNPRSVTTDAGTNFWVVGSNSGVRLVTLGSGGTSTSISTTNNTFVERISLLDNCMFRAEQGRVCREWGQWGVAHLLLLVRQLQICPAFPSRQRLQAFSLLTSTLV